MRFEWRERRQEDLRQWLAALAAVLLTGAGLGALHVLGMPVCLVHRLTGLPCLSCGSSRAALALLSGDPLAALKLQPLMVVSGLFAAGASAYYTGCLFLGRRVLRVRLAPGEWRVAGAALGALAALNWLYLVWRGV